MKKHTVYEMIIQIGDRLNIGNDNPQSRNILKSFIFDWKRRNPHLELIGAYIHADEGTLHAHLDYIPVATGYTRGMAVQNGLRKALENQGFVGDKANLTAQILWERRENAYLEQLCVEQGFEVVHPEREKQARDRRVHQAVEDYKTESFAAEIDENFAYNQRLVAQNEQLEENIKNNQKELKKAEKALKACKSRILTEKKRSTLIKLTVIFLEKLRIFRQSV